MTRRAQFQILSLTVIVLLAGSTACTYKTESAEISGKEETPAVPTPAVTKGLPPVYYPFTDHPHDSAVELGRTARLRVEILTNLTEYASYQWYRNGVGVRGATNQVLIIPKVTLRDVGLYACLITVDTLKESEPPLSVMSQAGSLMVWREGSIIVAGTPIPGSGGSTSGCPGRYSGYINYRKNNNPPTGWTMMTNKTNYSAADSNPNSSNRIKFFGIGGSMPNGCGTNKVDVATGASNYMFTLYFPEGTSVPTTNYSIILTNFNP